MSQDDAPSSRLRRLWPMIAAVVMGVSAAGYFTGLRDSRPLHATPHHRPDGVAPAGVLPAATYRHMSGAGRGPNREWVNHLNKLATAVPDLSDPVPPTPERRSADLAGRAARRAYDGAPPIVPHPIVQHSSESCLACHGEGLRVQDRIAPRVSHPHYASCTQCHVEAENRAIPASLEWAGNRFEGRSSPGPGPRAWNGAPPAIPHTTHMRNDCLSCHGANGPVGIRTSHPSRQSCTQCHAPAAQADQHPAIQQSPGQ